MTKLKLLLLEDLDKEASQLTCFLEKNDYEVVRAQNLIEAEIKIQNYFFDIIILDIMIEGRPEGIELAKRIQRQKANVPVLFLTSMQSKVIFDKAKLTNPMVYLLKPYNELELLYSLELAIEASYHQSNSISFHDKGAVISPSYLFIKKKNCVVKVDIDSIIFVEVKEKYCNIACVHGCYLIKLSLSKLKEIIGNANFRQVHRNNIININKIKEIYFEDNLIILEGDHQIPFSERYKHAFIKDNIIFR